MEKVYYKMKKILNYRKEILLFCFIFISIFCAIMVEPISDLDELWNYNAANTISKGLIPYKDISMITTPLLPMITSVFLNVITNEVMVTRLIASLIGAGVIFCIYKILTKTIKEENMCLIATALIGILFKDVYALDYNLSVVLIALIILYKEIKMQKKYITEKSEEYKNKTEVQDEIKEKKNKNILNFQNLIIGILAGLAFCTKQSTGAILSIIVIISPLLKLECKKKIKEYFKESLIRIVGIIIPIFLFCLYLIWTKSLTHFIDYAVSGISTFSNKISYMQLFKNELLSIKILALGVPLTICILAIIIIINSKTKNKIRNISNIRLLFIYSISILITMYPISDKVHFLMGSTITIISLVYLIFLFSEFVYSKISYKRKKRFYKIVSFIFWLNILVGIVLFDIENFIIYLNLEKNDTINHYKHIEISNYLKQQIDLIDKFIIEEEKKGKKVYILDAEAAVYMIPIDKYNKNYDLFLKGNLGKDGEDGVISDIQKKSKDVIYLISKPDKNLNWQTPIKVIEYARENLEKTGEISSYDIYENK